jgi:hypothetical protein
MTSAVTSGRTAPLPPRGLRRDLERDWARATVAAVSDEQLAFGVSALYEHQLKTPFFGDSFEGLRHVTYIDGAGLLDVILVPQRKGIPQARTDLGKERCALCNPADPVERGLSWRNYIVWPNRYPYVPADQQHMLVMPARHQPQGFSAGLLGDMIDYQRLASPDGAVSMSYNGIAGNSQFHLHWQAMRAQTPFQRDLDTDRLSLQTLRQEAGGTLQTFRRDYASGFLVRGNKQYVQRWASEIIRRLDHDPLTQGAYNLTLLQPRADQTRLLIAARRKSALPSKLSSLTMTGVVIVPHSNVPDHFAQKLRDAAKTAIVEPHEFAWLSELYGAKARTGCST